MTPTVNIDGTPYDHRWWSNRGSTSNLHHDTPTNTLVVASDVGRQMCVYLSQNKKGRKSRVQNVTLTLW
jgi:hypothetical protein